MSLLEAPTGSCYACAEPANFQCDVRNGTERCPRVACLTHSVEATLAGWHRCVQCHQLIEWCVRARQEHLDAAAAARTAV